MRRPRPLLAFPRPRDQAGHLPRSREAAQRKEGWAGVSGWEPGFQGPGLSCPGNYIVCPEGASRSHGRPVPRALDLSPLYLSVVVGICVFCTRPPGGLRARAIPWLSLKPRIPPLLLALSLIPGGTWVPPPLASIHSQAALTPLQTWANPPPRKVTDLPADLGHSGLSSLLSGVSFQPLWSQVPSLLPFPRRPCPSLAPWKEVAAQPGATLSRGPPESSALPSGGCPAPCPLQATLGWGPSSPHWAPRALFQRSSRNRRASCGPACPSAPASKRSRAAGH